MWEGGDYAPADKWHQWIFHPNGTIRCADGGGNFQLCLKPDGWNNGGGLHVWCKAEENAAHQWKVHEDGTIRSLWPGAENLGLCIKPDGGKNGGEVHMWDCGGSPSDCHIWLIEPVCNHPVTFRLVANQKLGFALKLNEHKDGGKTHMWEHSGDTSKDEWHQWVVIRDGKSGNFTIRCGKDQRIGLCTLQNGAENGKEIQMWTGGTDMPGADKEHQWIIKPDGTIRPAANPNIGLALKGPRLEDHAKNGGELHLWDCAPHTNAYEKQDDFHAFILEPVGGCVPGA